MKVVNRMEGWWWGIWNKAKAKSKSKGVGCNVNGKRVMNEWEWMLWCLRLGNIDGRRVIRKKNRVRGINRLIEGWVVFKGNDYWLNGLGEKKSKMGTKVNGRWVIKKNKRERKRGVM